MSFKKPLRAFHSIEIGLAFPGFFSLLERESDSPLDFKYNQSAAAEGW